MMTNTEMTKLTIQKIITICIDLYEQTEYLTNATEQIILRQQIHAQIGIWGSL